MPERGTDEENDWHLVFGTFEEARAMIGTKSEIGIAEVDIEWPMIKYFCASVEDANPSYWDADFAEREWGAVISPPGMLMAWYMPIPWRPTGRPRVPGLAPRVPLPGANMLNQSTESQFFDHIRVGDRLSFYDEVIDVSPEKRAGVGPGHFVTTTMTFSNSAGKRVATNTLTVFRYSPAEGN
jgi:acyl dehydratase